MCQFLQLAKTKLLLTIKGRNYRCHWNVLLFVFENQIVGGQSPLKKFGDIRKSEKVPYRLSYAPVELQGGGKIEIQLLIQWSPTDKLLHKWVKYSLSGMDHPILLKEIILDKLEATDLTSNLPTLPGQSYPVFMDGFFAGIEYPVSSIRKRIRED